MFEVWRLKNFKVVLVFEEVCSILGYLGKHQVEVLSRTLMQKLKVRNSLEWDYSPAGVSLRCRWWLTLRV